MADIKERWKWYFKRQNCIATKIAHYLDINNDLWPRLVNSVLEKCVTLMVNWATMQQYGNNYNYKYYCRNIINQWTTHYHYPSIEFESVIENIHDQYDIWNRSFIRGEPPTWNVFTNLNWSHALSFMKSVNYYIKIADVPENTPTRPMSCFEFDTNRDFLNIREFTHRYLGIVKDEGTNTYGDQGDNFDKQRKGIGYNISRMKYRNPSIVPWIHSGTSCKAGSDDMHDANPNYANLNARQKNTITKNGGFPGKFSRYIYEKMLPHFTALHPNTSIGLPFHNLPTQCSISGSTNAILSTLLWGTSNIVITKQDFSNIIPGIFALLCLDGGHTMQEVLSATCLISNFYKLFFDYKIMTGAPITCFNNYTINNLYEVMRDFEFLPGDIIITDLGLFFDISPVNINRIFSNIIDPVIIQPTENDYNNIVLFILTINRRATNTLGHNYFMFWTDTERYMNITLEYMITDPVYAAVPAYTYPVDEVCQREIDKGNFNGAGIASLKTIKNKKLRPLLSPPDGRRSPLRSSGPQSGPPEGRLLRSPRRSRGPILGPHVRRLRSSPKTKTSQLARKHTIKSFMSPPEAAASTMSPRSRNIKKNS